MTASNRSLCLRRKAAALALIVFVALLVCVAPSRPAFAQTQDELKAARELFQEAFKDEQEKRYSEALEKFQRVARVKESAAVRYRIATVLTALGRLREARDMYRALAATKSTSQPVSDQEIADSAAEKAAELDRRIPKLSVRMQDRPPPETRVTIDGAPVAVSSATASRIELDPGDHVVAATGRGVQPTEKTISLTDGGPEINHTVTFAVPLNANGQPIDPENGGNGGNNTTKVDHTVSWIAIGVGGALVLTGGVLLIAREGAINDIKTTCPNRLCPAARRDDVEGDTSRAELFGPLGVGLVVVGLAAVGYGVYTLVWGKPSRTQTPNKASSRGRENTPPYLLTPSGMRIVF